MKKILIKGVSLLTAFALIFASHTTWAIDGNEPKEVGEICNTKTFVSEEGNGMVPVEFIHEAWTASIDGAVWVWSEDPMSDTASEVTETFSFTFDVEGTPSDGVLEIAADNTYKIFVNDDVLPLVVDEDEDNYSSSDNNVIPTSSLVLGSNTITFEVTNLAQENGTQESNPAGLMFKFTFEDCVPDETEEPCGADNNPCDDGGNEPEEETCPVIYARVNFAKVDNGAQVDGWRNWEPGGDLEPQVFVGGTDPGDIYQSEDWFPLTEGDGTPLVDPDIQPYANVPGLAIERQDGKIRLVLYGYHDEENEELGGKEYASGVIELQGATWENMQSPLDWSNDNSNPRIHDPAISDSVNPMESRGDWNGGIDQYDYRFDRMRTITPTKVSFTLVVTAGADGFYASYDIPECGEEPEPCVGDDCEENPVEPTCEETQTCEPNDDDDSDDDDDTFDEDPGPTSSGGSRRLSSGGSVQGASTGPEGEVLGACVQFTEYHKKGDAQGEIARIQEFLNQEMGAGLIVDGYYGEATFKAVKDFQQKYFKEIISPWSPPLPLRVTGKWYKTTRMMANEIIGCPETEVYLEDPATFYKVNWMPAI